MTVVLAHDGHLVPTVGMSTAVLRWVVLLLAAAVAALLLRRGKPAWAVLASGAAAFACSTSAVVVLHRTAGSIWLAAVLSWATGTRDRSTARLAIGATVAAGVTGAWLALDDRVRLDGLPFDRLVVAKASLLIGAVVLATRQRHRIELVVLVLATAVGSALVLVPISPAAGLPLVSAAARLPVTVAPQRPGPNWVHVDTDRVVTVNGVRSSALAGTTGQWAQVTLPSGRSSLQVRELGRSWETLERGSVLIDAGHGSPVALDGPECVSAWIASPSSGSSCPSQNLSRQDADGLRGLMSWFSARHVGGVTVLGDDTPRSLAAQALLRTARLRVGLGDHGAVVVTSGWDTAAAQLSRAVTPRDGIYLSPWLAVGPLLTRFGTLAPLAVLPFDPGGAQALRYVSTIPAGETATPAGFAAWGGEPRAARVYASAAISILPRSLGHEHASGGWFPGGALTDVSGRLPTERTH